MRVSDVCGARAAASARGRLRLTAYVNVAGCQLPYYVGKAELVQVPTSYPYLLRTLTHIIVTYFMLFPHVSLKFICHRVVNSPAVVVDSTFLINFDLNMGQNNHTKYLPTFSTSLSPRLSSVTIRAYLSEYTTYCVGLLIYYLYNVNYPEAYC